MATALTTIDLLAASIQQSFVAANELILQSSNSTSNPPSAKPDAALDQQAQFIINNALGKPPVAIPLALFESPVRYYLSALHFDLPCYTMSGRRFFKWRRRAVTGVLHSSTPTLWQKLFYDCHLYHITVEVEVSRTKVSFHSASAEETVQPGGIIRRAAWEFRLSPEQEQELLALPEIVAKPIYWPSFLIRIWHWLSGKSKQMDRPTQS